MKVLFTHTTKTYKNSLNILVVLTVLILVEKLSKDYNSIKLSISKKTCKRPKILSGNTTLETTVMYGFYE